jgi:hypothetical protein
MGALTAPLVLIAARVRRRPWRWLPAVAGLALATGFASAVAAEGTIAGDQAARTVLAASPPLQRAVAVSWQGPGTPVVERQARGLLRSLGVLTPTRVVLMNPVRLSGVVVRPAAISPLPSWVGGTQAGGLGRCTERSCPVLLVGGNLRATRLDAFDVHLQVVGHEPLASPVPLGFVPGSGGGPPVVVTGDPRGLDRLAGLSGVYRTQDWVALPRLGGLHSWQLAGTERRLQRAQADLLQTGSQFTLSAPFAALDQARAEAAAAPRRLLAAGGGAVAALAMFLVLAAYALRHERESDVRRLLTAGARLSQRITFALGEAAALSLVALLGGLGLGLAAVAVLADQAGLPLGGVLSHSLFSFTGIAALAGGWLLATAVVSLVLLLPGGRAADVLAVAAAAALALTLTRGSATGGTLPALLAPLACLSAGVLVYRVAASVLRGGERLARSGPPLTRLALVSLARAPTPAALAIAFVAVSTGLGGFALGYRATLLRGTADQAANRVPLDALVAPSAAFTTPLQLAPLARWRSLAGGPVLPVRRTYATFASGEASSTVPALGIPARGLALIRGWRANDGSASLAVLAQRLRPAGPVRTPGPTLGSRGLALTMSATGGAVDVTADLRDSAGAVHQVPVGTATARRRVFRLRVPRAGLELEALELDEPTGLAVTNGHQNGENGAPATQGSNRVSLGPLRLLGRTAAVALGPWRAVGAAADAGHSDPRVLHVLFADSGTPGIVRPLQPSDTGPLPVLVDPGTAAAAAEGGRLALTVDGLPVDARIVGILNRFPTLPAGGAGFIVADEATLAAALDASLPGQGRPDELWIDTRHPAALTAALGRRPLSSLSTSLRSRIERRLRADPIARGVLGTLVAAAAIGLALALLGLLMALLGSLRDARAERELRVYGLGPRALTTELRLRVALAAGLGLLAGFALAAILTRLAVAAVRTATTLAAPQPPLVTVTPWGELALLALAALVTVILSSWPAAASVVGRGDEG